MPLAATATDPDGIVQRVEYFASGLKLGEGATNASWTFNWPAAGSGSYAVWAVATDDTAVRASEKRACSNQ